MRQREVRAKVAVVTDACNCRRMAIIVRSNQSIKTPVSIITYEEQVKLKADSL